MSARISVVIADDHPIVLDGLESVLRLAPDMEICARCVNGAEALEAVRAHQPDVLVLDIRMSRLDGFQILGEMRTGGSATRVVILSAALSDEDVLAALRLGARGIVPKEVAPEQVVEAIRSVHTGEQWVEPRISARLLGAAARGGDAGDAAEALTPREIELVKLVAAGLRNKEIAAKLSITEGTVKLHLHHIYRKLKVQSRVELALYERSRDRFSRE